MPFRDHRLPFDLWIPPLQLHGDALCFYCDAIQIGARGQNVKLVMRHRNGLETLSPLIWAARSPSICRDV